MNIARMYPVYDRFRTVVGHVRRNAYSQARALVSHSVCWTERGSEGRGWIDTRAVFRERKPLTEFQKYQISKGIPADC